MVHDKWFATKPGDYRTPGLLKVEYELENGVFYGLTPKVWSFIAY